MSVSGISSSSFFNTQSANLQNQQQWQQEFQKLTQELQSGTLASPGAVVQNRAQVQIATAQPGAPSSPAPNGAEQRPRFSAAQRAAWYSQTESAPAPSASFASRRGER